MGNRRNMHHGAQNWCIPSEDLRVRHLMDNALSKCSYCKGSGHYASSCQIKQENESNTLSAQLAAAITQSLPPQSSSQQNSSRNSQQQSQTWRNSDNFRGNQNQQQSGASASGSIHPSKKPCWRFNSGVPCEKPPCIFHHGCRLRPSTTHGAHNCRKKHFHQL